MSPDRRFLRTNQTVLPHSPPPTRRPFPRARRRLDASGSKRASRMAISRNAYSLLIPMSVPTIPASHLVDRFPDGILTSSSGPPASYPALFRHAKEDNTRVPARWPQPTGICYRRHQQVHEIVLQVGKLPVGVTNYGTASTEGEFLETWAELDLLTKTQETQDHPPEEVEGLCDPVDDNSGWPPHPSERRDLYHRIRCFPNEVVSWRKRLMRHVEKTRMPFRPQPDQGTSSPHTSTKGSASRFKGERFEN